VVVVVRHSIKIRTVAAIALTLQQPVCAAKFGPPPSKFDFGRLSIDKPALPPLAHTRFCLRYPAECEIRNLTVGTDELRLTPARWAELTSINSIINRSIVPGRTTHDALTQSWLLAPKSGGCNDYAVTKRHELLKRGWPSRALLLAEVITFWGEHHLVLVIRTDAGDLVADNLHSGIRSWSMPHYHWVRLQSPEDPKFWATVANTPI
jgi:predicted transglutaminase-like cysteine proteinase